MELMLDHIEARVLGCLIEKEMTTPEYYPLSLNALVNACNQKSNRDPVMELSDEDVVKALDSLKFKQLAVVAADGGRVPKYRHVLAEQLHLLPAELAVLCELLVRGPQTLGEIRGRCERMHQFSELAAAEQVLSDLMGRETPLVVRMARQPGRKECRYAHLFLPVPDSTEEGHEAPPEAARLRVMAGNERIDALEEEVLSLRAEVTRLRTMMEEFKSQFE